MVLRSRRRTRYFAVPRTLATTSPGVLPVMTTLPLAKYDWPRARTASLKSRETFWAIPIMPSRNADEGVEPCWSGPTGVGPAGP